MLVTVPVMSALILEQIPNPANNCVSSDISVQDPIPFYSYNAYDPDGVLPEGPASLYQTDPASMTSLAATTSSDFICAGTARRWRNMVWCYVQ